MLRIGMISHYVKQKRYDHWLAATHLIFSSKLTYCLLHVLNALFSIALLHACVAHVQTFVMHERVHVTVLTKQQVHTVHTETIEQTGQWVHSQIITVTAMQYTTAHKVSKVMWIHAYTLI